MKIALRGFAILCGLFLVATTVYVR